MQIVRASDGGSVLTIAARIVYGSAAPASYAARNYSQKHREQCAHYVENYTHDCVRNCIIVFIKIVISEHSKYKLILMHSLLVKFDDCSG